MFMAHYYLNARIITNTKINSAYHTKSLPDLVAFLYAAAFSPSTNTWLNAIKKGVFQSWPGLTTEVVSKYLPKSPATAMGHMDQTRKHVRYTKTRQGPEITKA